MAIQPSFRDGLDVPLSGPIVFNPLPGVPTSEAIVRVWNDFGDTGADPMLEASLLLTARTDGSSGEYSGDGFRLLETLGTRIRISGSSMPEVSTTTAQGVGTGAALRLPEIRANHYVELSISIALDGATVSSIALDMRAALDLSPTQPVGSAVENRVISGEGDVSATLLAYRDGPTAASGPPDAFVALAAHSWLHKGLAVGQAAESVEFDDLDGSGAALALGEYYAAAWTLGATGLTLTKGDKLSTAPGVDGLPVLPVDEPLATWVAVRFGLEIEQLDIFDVLPPNYFTATAAGLVVAIGPGSAYSNGYEVRWDVPRVINVPDDAESIIYLSGSIGEPSLSNGARDLPLWHASAAAGVVTLSALFSASLGES